MVKVEVENVKPSSKKLHIEVPVEKVKEKREKIISHLKKTVNLRGFRKGKVPKNVIEQTYKKEIDEDTQRELIAEAYEFAIQDNKIKTVSEPAFSAIEYANDKPLKFDVTVDVKPEIELKEYKGIEVEKKVVKVTEEDINKTINQLRDAFAELEDKEGTAEEGDIAIVDIKTFDSQTNYPIKDFTGENLYIEVGKKQLLEEIEKEIYTMKSGESKEVEASFDNDYPLRALKGKTVKFEITLKSLKAKKLPELNEEFAKKINKDFKSLDDLKADIEKRLLENKEKEEKERQKDALLNKILEEYDFELPMSLVNQETNQMMVEYVKNMYYMGADINSDEYKPQNLRKKFEKEAQKRVKATFVLLAIAEKEGLDVSSEEINKAIAQDANAKNTTFEELYKEYQEKGLLPVVQMDILGDKALELVYENAKIIEAKPEETENATQTKEVENSDTQKNKENE